MAGGKWPEWVGFGVMIRLLLGDQRDLKSPRNPAGTLCPMLALVYEFNQRKHYRKGLNSIKKSFFSYIKLSFISNLLDL